MTWEDGRIVWELSNIVLFLFRKWLTKLTEMETERLTRQTFCALWRKRTSTRSLYYNTFFLSPFFVRTTGSDEVDGRCWAHEYPICSYYTLLPPGAEQKLALPWRWSCYSVVVLSNIPCGSHTLSSEPLHRAVRFLCSLATFYPSLSDCLPSHSVINQSLPLSPISWQRTSFLVVVLCKCKWCWPL